MLLLAACGEDAKPAFENESIRESVGAPVRWDATSAERFRLERMPRANAPAGGATAAAAALQWTTPAGWSELPPTSMRSPNFRVAGDEHAECYLTTLSGEGGGLAANLDRWRGQMSQPPFSPAEIDALPRVQWLGQQAVFVQIDGTWTGMGGSEDASDYRLVGALLVTPSSSRFLKMIGPRDLIARETDAFHGLLASFRAGGAPAGASAGANPAPSGTGSLAAPSAPSLPAAASGGGAFTWTVPVGWKLGPQKAMREVTLLGGPQGEVECYVSALGGEAGGLISNLSRWRQQLDQPPIDEAEAAQLPRVAMLGGEAPVLEVARTDDPGADAVLGAAYVNPQGSVFVKMLGKKAAIEREREAFLGFCRSLRANR